MQDYTNRALYILLSVLCAVRAKKLQLACFFFCFFLVQVSENLWSAIQNYVQNNLYLPDLSDENVYLGFISNNSPMKLENHILLAFKRFLFENRREKFVVNPNGFWKSLMHIQKIEFQIASRNGKLKGYSQKWNTISVE